MSAQQPSGFQRYRPDERVHPSGAYPPFDAFAFNNFGEMAGQWQLAIL